MKKTSREIEIEILRLYHAERWKPGTISRQLGLHHNVIERVLREANESVPKLSPRASMVDSYLPFIHETLETYPRLPSVRLYHMVRERGYPGSESHFRRIIGGLRPRRKVEAFLRLRTLPGEQAQVDWAHFGKIPIGKALRTLWAFVMVLSYSRVIYVRFFVSARMPSFLSGHVGAFHAFGGVPRILLYDNLKSAVLERKGDAIRFHPTLLEFAGHYRFGPRPVAPRRGNEKGRVERAIRYLRTNFFVARPFTDVDDLNRQVSAWCQGPVRERRWPQDKSKTVMQAFEEEGPTLQSLPDDDFPCQETLSVTVGKTPYVRFDKNDYSVPHAHVKQVLTLSATNETVTIADGTNVLATHERCFGVGACIETKEHMDALWQEKRAARMHRGIDRLAQAVPCAQDFLALSAERGLVLSRQTRLLTELLDDYGPKRLQNAIVEIRKRDIVDIAMLTQLLEQWRHAEGSPPPIAVRLPSDPRVINLVVTPHDLASYDQKEEDDDEKE